MTQFPSAEDSPLFVAALARGVSVLRAFSEGRPAMTLPELAEATGLSKSSVQRFTHTLWTLGYLRKDPASKKFSLGPWSLELGMKYVQTSPLVLGGNPFLHSLNRNCQETCSLAEPDGLDMVYVARFATHKEMFVNMPVGMRLPLYCTAAGRAVLSRLDPDVAHWLLGAATVDPIPPPRSPAWTPCWLSWSSRAGTAMHVQWRVLPGDITVSAAVLDAGGIPWARSMCRFHPAAGRSNRRRPCLVRRWSKPRMPSACRAPWDVLIPSTSWSLPAARCALRRYPWPAKPDIR